MGHAPGQDADGLHFLRLAQLLFQPFAHGDVAHHGQQEHVGRQVDARQADLGVERRAVGPAMDPFKELGIPGVRGQDLFPGFVPRIAAVRLQGR